MQDIFNIATNRAQMPFPLREEVVGATGSNRPSDMGMSISGMREGEISGQKRRVSDIELTRAGGHGEVTKWHPV